MAMKQEVGLTRLQIYWHLDLGLPSRTVRNKLLLFMNYGFLFCYSAQSE